MPLETLHQDGIRQIIVDQYITAEPPMYKCMVCVLKGDAKAEIISCAAAQGNHTVEHYAFVGASMTKHVFPAFSYRDQKRHLS